MRVCVDWLFTVNRGIRVIPVSSNLCVSLCLLEKQCTYLGLRQGDIPLFTEHYKKFSLLTLLGEGPEYEVSENLKYLKVFKAIFSHLTCSKTIHISRADRKKHRIVLKKKFKQRFNFHNYQSPSNFTEKLGYTEKNHTEKLSDLEKSVTVNRAGNLYLTDRFYNCIILSALLLFSFFFIQYSFSRRLVLNITTL